ncbi:MAG: patatin-like phospholipase family protein [Deltaproteobacteria bacterium]|nr:patatin-like phospholipase family protein [Deltaproteobacteria bacterium]
MSQVLSSRELLEHRKPFEDLEAEVLERFLADPRDLGGRLIAGLRYVLNFAKLTTLRNRDGEDIDVQGALRAHAWRVRERIEKSLGERRADGLWGVVRELPELVRETRDQRRHLLEHFPLDRVSLDREVCTRKFVLVLGGGGGAGYGYAGVFTQLHRHDLNPSLICGTSIGALLGIFRARSRAYDAALLLQANKSLTWNKLFKLGPEESRYGLPATLRMHLRASLGEFLRNEDGEVMRISQLPVPLHVVATGLTVDALRHELAYYEHFLDDVVKQGLGFRTKRLSQVANLANIMREFAANPQALREVVFGRDEGTLDMDCIDCAGFSASVPGLLHYDVHRDDQRMKHLLDQLYAARGITRLTEGGVVNNVPARVGFRSAMEGRLDGHRNVSILAVDCFPVRRTSLLFYPLMQVARANVVKNIPYANIYVALPRTLSPLNLVPRVDDVAKASRWAMDALEPRLPLLRELNRPFAPLRDEH